MLPLLCAALRFPLPRLPLANRISLLSIPGADALGIIPIAKMRQFDPAHWNADQVLAFFADQFPLGQEFAQILSDPALNDLPETLVIFFDLEDHFSLF